MTELENYSQREAKIHSDLQSALKIDRYKAFELCSAIQGILGMARDYGFLGEIHRMQVETLAISLSGGGDQWLRYDEKNRNVFRELARDVGRNT